MSKITPPPIISDLMTLPDAMAYLKVSRPHLYHLMANEGLPARKLSKRWTFSRAELDDWIKSRPGINLPDAG